MKVLVMALFAFSVSTASAGGPTLIKKDYICSDNATYRVYITKTSGITNSYKVSAFCMESNDDGLQACLEDESDEAFICYKEFKDMNPLTAGDGELVIVHGR